MRKVNVIAATLLCLAATGDPSGRHMEQKNQGNFQWTCSVACTSSKVGLVSLAPGTYIFRLSDSQANRHLVQVTNQRGDHVYTTILAIPDYRLNATSKTVMYFSERPAGHPPAIKSWFYPGDNYGHRFVYPKVQAVQIAQETNSQFRHTLRLRSNPRSRYHQR